MSAPAPDGRLCLGTVQLGLAYGVRANFPLMSDAEANELFDVAWAHGIRDFDTAMAYGRAPQRLADWLSDRGKAEEARVTTKVDPRLGTADRERAFQQAVRPFRNTAATRLLAHGAITASDIADWRESARACAMPSVAIGASVYSVEEAQSACGDGADVVQLPMNALNDRGLERLATFECAQVQVRSIFLQGLLIQTPDAAERRVPGSARLVLAVHEVADELGLEPAHLLLASMHHLLPPHMIIVLGAETPAQIEDWVAALRTPADIAHEGARRLRRLPIECPPAVLDPRCWPVLNPVTAE